MSGEPDTNFEVLNEVSNVIVAILWSDRCIVERSTMLW